MACLPLYSHQRDCVMSSKALAGTAGRAMRRLSAAPHCSPSARPLVLCRTLDALPGLRRGIPPRWGNVRSLALGQRVAVWSARAGQTTRDISVRVSQTSTNVIECAAAADDLFSLSTLRLHLQYGASTMRYYSKPHATRPHAAAATHAKHCCGSGEQATSYLKSGGGIVRPLVHSSQLPWVRHLSSCRGCRDQDAHVMHLRCKSSV